MSLLYLIRHGQAGLRDHYDCLSPLGRRQSRLLGAWLARQDIRFDAVWTGALTRQKETADLVLAALAESGFAAPQPLEDPRWNEFDLDAVYAAFAPPLAADDPLFRRYYESLQQALASGQGEIHRRWTEADSGVVNAWIHARYPFAGESWAGFVQRVRAAAGALLAAPAAGRRVAVFTSGTPIAIALSHVFPLDARHILQLSGASMNSNVTILRANGARPALACFNSVAHLDLPELRTFR